MNKTRAHSTDANAQNTFLLEFATEIKRERKRLGGNWAISGFYRPGEIAHLQTIIDPEMVTVVLSLDPTMQEERLVARHPGKEIIPYYLSVSENFPKTWNTKRTLQLVQERGSSLEENSQRVIDMIKNYM